jgi:hypothetical protein
MAEPVLDASRVVAGVGQGVAAGMAEHVSVDRKGEAGAAADALAQPIDGIGRERAAALRGEDEGAVGQLPPQHAQGSESRRRAADAGQLIRLIGLWLLGQQRVQRRFDAIGRSLR